MAIPNVFFAKWPNKGDEDLRPHWAPATSGSPPSRRTAQRSRRRPGELRLDARKADVIPAYRY